MFAAGFCVLHAAAAGFAAPLPGPENTPIQLTFESGSPVLQASTVVGVMYDTTLGLLENLHIAWLANNEIHYRSGRLSLLSRDMVINQGTQANADPVLALSRTGKLAIAWSEEKTPNGGIVPGEWNLRYTSDPYIAPRWLTEDNGIARLFPDRHPTMVARNDTVLIIWERGTPSQIVYTILTPLVPFPPIRGLTDYPYPAVRPIAAEGPSGEFWAVWTAETPAGGDIWATKITADGFAPPTAVRVGGGDDRFPALAVDREGRPHIVWQEGATGGPIRYVYGLLGGGFSPLITLTSSGRVTQHPQIIFMEDGVPRVAWQNVANGAIEMTMVFGTEPLAPVTIIGEAYQPRQRDIWPVMVTSPFNKVLTSFIATDPINGIPNVWINIGIEGVSGGMLSRLTAEPVRSNFVRLRWRFAAPELVSRFEVCRIRADEHAIGPSTNVASIPVSAGQGPEFDVLDHVREAGSYVYRVDAVDSHGATLQAEFAAAKVSPSSGEPHLRAMPNPFNGATSVLIDLKQPAEVRADIFTIVGHCVATLADAQLAAGQHRLRWDGRDGEGRAVGSGVYRVRCRFAFDDGSILVRTLPLTLLR